MLQALHLAGHRYLKVLFMCALAGSSALFFVGSAFPQPPRLLVVLIGAGLGIAVEWSYFVVSCDLTEAITEKDTGAIWRSGLFTLIGAGASWFLFTNAALHVGWAPADDLIGLDRQTWAGIMGALVVGIVLALSIRRRPPEHSTDLQAIARAVTIMLPDASDAVKLRMLGIIAQEASKIQAPVVVSSPLPALTLAESEAASHGQPF